MDNLGEKLGKFLLGHRGKFTSQNKAIYYLTIGSDQGSSGSIHNGLPGKCSGPLKYYFGYYFPQHDFFYKEYRNLFRVTEHSLYGDTLFVRNPIGTLQTITRLMLNS